MKQMWCVCSGSRSECVQGLTHPSEVPLGFQNILREAGVRKEQLGPHHTLSLLQRSFNPFLNV